MEKYFVTYDQALALRELGFDEPCVAFYQKEYTEQTPVMVDDDKQYSLTGWRTCRNSQIPKHYTSAPLKSQVFEWIRTKYKYYFWIEPCSQHKIFHFNITGSPSSFTYWSIDETKPNAGGFESYEEAELACLDKLIEIFKNKNYESSNRL